MDLFRRFPVVGGTSDCGIPAASIAISKSVLTVNGDIANGVTYIYGKDMYGKSMYGKNMYGKNMYINQTSVSIFPSGFHHY